MIEKLKMIPVPVGDYDSDRYTSCIKDVPSNKILMDKINELVDAYNKVDSDSLKEAVIEEHRKNREAMRALMDDLIARGEKESKDKADKNIWFNFYNSALNRSGDTHLSRVLADEALDVFKKRFPEESK